MSALGKLRSRWVCVPDSKNPGTTVLKPVFDGMYANTDSITVTMMSVSDRAEAWYVYKKMSKCPFAWLYRYWVSLGYSDSMVRSLMEGLGPNTYFMAREASTFNQETLEVEIEFNKNQSEIGMRKIEQDLELDDDSVVVNACEVHYEVVTEMADTRTFQGRKRQQQGFKW